MTTNRHNYRSIRQDYKRDWTGENFALAYSASRRKKGEGNALVVLQIVGVLVLSVVIFFQ